MDVTRERISLILELREILLSLQTSFSLVNAAGVVCHQFGLLGTDLHAVGCGGFVKTLN